MKETIIGIDLGTTNSEVAVIENGKPVVIAVEGSLMLPSFVGIGDDGSILVGEPARNQYKIYPERTVKSIKRRMGEDTRVALGKDSYTPQEISAIILKRLRNIAEGYLGKKVEKAVITVPAYFSDAQRQATREAGEIAGIEVVKIINEPTTAALSYESGSHDRKRLLVYDLGGGTFDVSVVEMEEGVIEVVASHGNNHLGGDDFDQLIVGRILEHLRTEHGVNDPLPARALARVDRAAEAAKRVLSDHPFVRIEEEYLLERDGPPVHLSLELSREEYEVMIMPFIEETLAAIHIALKSAGFTVSNIEEILLVGGSTRTPLVARRLEEELGMQPRTEVDPDLCVATGAAIQAGMIAGETVSAVLVDITPYTFGTSAFHELDGEPYPFFFVPIIRKNTPIPVTKSEVFYTMFDGQETVMVEVYQGEDPDAKKNIKIGEFMIEGLRSGPAGSPIISRFELDKDGILQVIATEKKTGLAKKITIDNAISRFQNEELFAAKERISALFGTEEERGFERAVSETDRHEAVKARALVEKAERLLDGASDEDREEMVNLVERINETLDRKDFAALDEPMEQLAELIFYLES